jgi:hypothetical protein
MATVSRAHVRLISHVQFLPVRFAFLAFCDAVRNPRCLLFLNLRMQLGHTKIVGVDCLGQRANGQAATQKLKPWESSSMEEEALRVADLCRPEERYLNELADAYEGRL